jgi:hypothetical protein
MACVRVKEGVTAILSPAGIRFLATLDAVARLLGRDITITSGSDGLHSGLDDPHHKGNAYDIRTHDDPDKGQLVTAIENKLAETDPGKFYVFIEDEGSTNEHIHGQLRKEVSYP